MRKNSALVIGLMAGLFLIHSCTQPQPPAGSTGGAGARSAADVYDFYPGTGYYPSGTAAEYPWQTPDGVGVEGFESYPDGAIIESSAEKGLQTHLEVTSGVLTSKYLSGGLYRRAKTETYNFRMLAQGLSGGQRVKWTDQTLKVRVYVDSWQATSSSWQGVHLFGRYRTEDNLYVASLRRDGSVVVKKVVDNVYTTLADGPFHDGSGNPRTFNTNQWYKLTLSVVGNLLTFAVDGVSQLEVTSGTFSWGTMGIRTDYANVYLDEMAVSGN